MNNNIAFPDYTDGPIGRVRGYNWYRAQKQRDQQPIRGTQIAVTQNSDTPTICGRLLDQSVTAGGALGAIPINSGAIGINNLGGTAYPAPTLQGSPTLTSSGTPLACDVTVQCTVNNVPQDGNVAQVLWLFRRNGTSTWTPWAEVPLSGLPYPPASQAISFGYGQLQAGLSYDFGIAYISARGDLGAITAVTTNYAVTAVSIPSSYMLGGTAINPAVGSLTNTIGASTNGISTPCTINWTCTNQPTDGSLSRVAIWFRQAQAGATVGSSGTAQAGAWAYYASLPAVGVNLASPPASASYSFVFTDLANGISYDFGFSYENAQGGETNVTAGFVGITMPNVLAQNKMPTAQMNNGPQLTVTLQSPLTGAGTANPIAVVGATIGDWTANNAPSWFLGLRTFLRVHGQTTYQNVGDITPGQAVTFNTQVALGAAQSWDIGFAYLDNAGNVSTIVWPAALSNINAPAVGPVGIGSLGGPNLVPDSGFNYANFNSSGIGSNDPYWNFYLIDGASFFVGRGSGNGNYLGVRPGDSNKTCKAQSEVMVAQANTLYTVSAYIDATTCSGTNQPYISLVSTDQSVEYARASQTIGKNGIVSAQYTTPASGGPTQFTVMFNSNNCTINSSILVFAQPMLQVGNLGPYTAGPSVSGGAPSGTGNNPPPAGGSGGGAGDPGSGSGDGGGYHKNKTMPYQVRGVVADSIDTFGSYVKVGSIHRLHLEQSGQPGGTNLIYNPTFANGTAGWNRNIPGSSQVLGVSTDTFGGGRLNLTGATMANGAYDGFFQSIGLPFTGQTMMCSGILEAAAVSGVSYNVEVLNASQGTLLGNFVFDNSKGSGRQPFAFRCDNGSNGTIVVRFYTHNTSGASINVGTMTVYKLQIEYGTTPSPFVDHFATAGHTKLFDANNALLASSTMNTRVPNVTPFRHNTHIWCSFPVGSTTLTYYIDDGGGAGAAPTFWRPDGSNFASAGIGNWNAKTGGIAVTGLTANANAYLCAYYVPGDTSGVNGTGWHVTVQNHAFGINDTPIAQAYADGGYIAVQASTGSTSTIASGTSGAVSTGGGGGGGRMTN